MTLTLAKGSTPFVLAPMIQTADAAFRTNGLAPAAIISLGGVRA